MLAGARASRVSEVLLVVRRATGCPEYRPAHDAGDQRGHQDAQLGRLHQRGVREGQVGNEQAHREVDPCQTTSTVDVAPADTLRQDLKSTRLNSSHANISYAVFCLK